MPEIVTRLILTMTTLQWSNSTISAHRLTLDTMRLIVAAGANFLLALLYPSVTGSLLATAVLATFFYRVAQAHIAVFALLLPLAIPHFAAQLSLNFISFGAAMPEIGYEGDVNSAPASFALINILFFGAAALVLLPRIDRPNVARSEHHPYWNQLSGYAAFAASAAAAAYLISLGLGTGFPLITGTDRLLYRATMGGVLFNHIINLKFLFSVALGIVFAQSSDNPARRRMALSIYATLVALYFLFGDKFFTILVSLCFFVLPLVVLRPEQARRQIAAIAPLAVAVLALALTFTLYLYSDYGTAGIEIAFVRLGERIAGQGQLWFLYTKEEFEFLHFDSKLIAKNLMSMLASEPGLYNFYERIATFHFTDKYAPFSIIEALEAAEGSVSLTICFEAYAAAMFGFFGAALAMVGMGMVAGLILTYCARALTRGDWVSAMAPFFLLVMFWTFFNQGTVNSLLSPGSIKQFLQFWAVGTAALFIRGLLHKPVAP